MSSNMAVMEIELPSGFTVDEQSIPGLYKYQSVKRVETAEGDTKVIIYFDEVSGHQLAGSDGSPDDDSELIFLFFFYLQINF